MSTAYVLNLSFMDLNSAAESLALSVGLTFGGKIDLLQVEDACSRIAKAWPLLGAHIFLDNETNQIKAAVPPSESAKLKHTSRVLDATLAEVEKPYTKTETISTQVTLHNEDLYRDHPLRDIEYYLSSGKPAFALHTAYLRDATIFTLTFLHLLMDTSGFSEFAKAFILALDGKPIPPLSSRNPWSALLPRALHLSENPETRTGWTIWGAEQLAASRQAEQNALKIDGPVQQRTVYFPASEILRLKREAIKELRSAGHSISFLSSTDIVAAWLYKHTFIDIEEVERKNRFFYVVHASNRFPDAFPPEEIYIHNAFFIISTENLTDAQLHSMSLAEVAHMIRLSVQKQTTQEQLLSQLKWKYKHAGQTQIPFSPGERLHGSSSWLAFGLGDLNVTKHIKQGTGTGKVLDVFYDTIGGGRYLSAIKFRDAEGGIVCNMDFGTRRWISGKVAGYALEGQA